MQDAKCIVGLICDGMAMHCTHDEFCSMLLTLWASDNRPGTAARGKRYVVLVDVFQMLICFEDWDNISVKCNTYGACECRSPRDFTDTSQWRRHNCICETRAVEKLSPHRTGSGGCPDRGSSKHLATTSFIHTTTHRAYMCFQAIFIFACGPGNNAVWMSSFCTVLWKQMKHDLRLRVCSLSRHICAVDKFDAIRERGCKVRLSISVWYCIVASLSWVPVFYLVDRLLNDIVKLFCRDWSWLCL